MQLGISPVERLAAAYFAFLRRVARTDTVVQYRFWRLFHHLDTLEAALGSPVLLMRAIAFWCKDRACALVGKQYRSAPLTKTCQPLIA